jgi:hypothetical protein
MYLSAIQPDRLLQVRVVSRTGTVTSLLRPNLVGFGQRRALVGLRVGAIVVKARSTCHVPPCQGVHSEHNGPGTGGHASGHTSNHARPASKGAQPASDSEPGPRKAPSAIITAAVHIMIVRACACARRAQGARCASHGAMIRTGKLADGPFTGKLELATGKL